MRSTVLAVLSLLLAAVAQAQVATPSAGPDVTDLEVALQEYVGEVQDAIPQLQQQLRAEDAATRQFDQYLRRMRADAAMQRTVLALGNIRPPGLAQATRNWKGWESIARDRLAQASEMAESTTQARQDEEDRWGLLGDESPADLAASLGNGYAQAQALHDKKLALLSRLQALVQRGTKDAKSAIQVCQDIEAAIGSTAARQQQRFLWTRVRLATLPATLGDAQADLALMIAPFTTASVSDGVALVRDVIAANWVAVLTGLVLVIAVFWRGRAVQQYLRARAGPPTGWHWVPRGRPQRFFLALSAALSRSLVSGLIAAAALLLRLSLGDSAPPWSQPLLSLAIALFIWRLVYTLVGAAFDPSHPEYRLTTMDDAAAAGWRRRLQRLVLWLLLTTVSASLVERSGLTSAVLMLVFVLVELLALRSLAAVLREDRLAAAQIRPAVAVWGQRWRQLVRAGVLLLIGLSGFGFLNLAWFVGWGLLKSSVLLAGAVLVWRLGEDLLAQWDAGLPVPARRSAAGAWSLLVVAVSVTAMPFVWGVDEPLWRLLQGVLSFGVAIGDHHITVLRVAGAVAWLVSMWLGGRLFGVLLERRIFPRTFLDMGVRTAIVRTSGYVLITLGALAAVRTLGFDLTNLAIMAGALGVGIGFGLQTLVSNFVSGLIILFERPFKLGDILEQDGVFGYVRRIRTRSTVLRTFDESEIVLPNADLLAHKITNWTLTDNRARAILSVGVAYGSDVVKVRDTLYRVAKEHPRVLDEPRVYFTSFGGSSLDFRLMVWIDIRERLQVLSDLHFAIDAAFREAGIRIS